METHLYPKKNTQAFPSEADKQDKVILQCCTLKIRGGVERDSQGKKAGKGPLIQWDKSATLGVSQDQTLFVWRETDADHRISVMDGE